MSRRTKIMIGGFLAGAVTYTLLSWMLPVYHYTSSDGGFDEIEVPWKGRRFDVVTNAFRTYQLDGHPDAVLMRTFERRWAHPNLWLDNLTHERWRLPLAPTDMNYPDDANGAVLRRMEEHGFDFASEHVVDFHAVFATEAEADRIARLYVADHKAGDTLTNIETKPFEKGGMELTLSKKMLVTYEAVSAFEAKLAERVSQVDGYLDGWGVLQP